jgi:hypothetical protein
MAETWWRRLPQKLHRSVRSSSFTCWMIANGCADPPAGPSQRLVRSGDAPVTDEYARTGDEGFYLFLLLPAERARWALSLAGAVSPPATASPGRFHNLMHALMTQAKGLSSIKVISFLHMVG